MVLFLHSNIINKSSNYCVLTPYDADILLLVLIRTDLILTAVGLNSQKYTESICIRYYHDNRNCDTRNYYKDEEIAFVAHNDPHAGNMMMDKK